jgi:hypothetical protein
VGDGEDTGPDNERKAGHGSTSHHEPGWSRDTEKRTAWGKEIVLIRRASDHSAGIKGGGVPSFGGTIGTGGGWADGASRLAQGIGVDTRRYIEGLLSLNR